MSKQFVNSLEDKQPVQSIFLMKEKFLLKGKNGKSYLSVVLSDKSGSVDGRIWDNAEELSQSFQSGDFVRVKGMVQLFQNRKQVVIHKMEKTQPNDQELKDFIQVSSHDPNVMLARLLELIQTIQDPHIRQLTLNVVQSSEIQTQLLQCPAAKTIHHAYRGGLLEHILSICEIMTFVASHYPSLNRDLLYFGAIFHDIGKIWELSYEGGTTYTDPGRLIGHLVMAVELIESESGKMQGFPQELKMVLKHIVLSHHGRLEYGSPKTPQFLEAFVVAFIDDFDSKMNTIQMYMESERQTGEKWSRFNQLFERYFYLGISAEKAYGHPPEKPKSAPEIWAGEPLSESPPALTIPTGHAGLSYKTSHDS